MIIYFKKAVQEVVYLATIVLILATINCAVIASRESISWCYCWAVLFSNCTQANYREPGATLGLCHICFSRLLPSQTTVTKVTSSHTQLWGNRGWGLWKKYLRMHVTCFKVWQMIQFGKNELSFRETCFLVISLSWIVELLTIYVNVLHYPETIPLKGSETEPGVLAYLGLVSMQSRHSFSV